MARCYILASMSNVLQHQHQAIDSAYAMMLNLNELFGSQNRVVRQLAMRNLMPVTTVDGKPVRDYVLRMMGYLNEIEILDAEIEGESQTDIILQSLPSSFEQLCVNFNMNKRNYTLAELLIELQSIEALLTQTGQALLTNVPWSSKPQGWKSKRKENSLK